MATTRKAATAAAAAPPPAPPTAIAAMATDHSTEDNIAIGELGAWKRSNLDEAISGSGSEGVLFEIVTAANKAFELGNLLIRITP